ncbi:ABC transporter ATP-binding protein [Nesterenkonia sp. Hz 6-5]|nr:ABC transporter ATP-binding protein [Nesterenkonia haasae]
MSFHRDGRSIIEDVTFTAPPGAITALIGPNAAGKSTLLQLIAHLDAPTRGQVYLGDKNLTALTQRDRAKAVAFIDQHSATDQPLTVQETVMLGRTPHLGRLTAPSVDDRQVVKDALERTGAQYLSHRDFTELSGGERQRVLLARALAQQPILLLLDEPTNHLDPRAQLQTLALLRALASEGLAVITALHDINLAALHADRVIAIADGRIMAAGEVAAVLTPALISSLYDVDVQALSSKDGTVFSYSLSSPLKD